MLATRSQKICLIAGADSFLRTGLGLMTSLELGDAEQRIIGVGPPSDRLLQTICDEFGVFSPTMRRNVFSATLSAAILRPSVVLLGMTGQNTFVASLLLRVLAPRTVQISFVSGIAWPPRKLPLRFRANTDFFVVWSQEELRRFRLYQEPWMKVDLLLRRLPSLSKSYPTASGLGHHDVIFWAQAKFPPTLEERRELLAQLARNYDRILLKVRSAPREVWEPHAEVARFEDLLTSFPRHIQRQFTVVGGPSSQVMMAADRALTISSTAALESLAAGVDVQFITDFGVNSRLLNDFAFGSNLLGPLSDTSSRKPNPHWLEQNYFHDQSNERQVDLSRTKSRTRLLCSSNLKLLATLLTRKIMRVKIIRGGKRAVKRVKGVVRRLLKGVVRRLRAACRKSRGSGHSYESPPAQTEGSRQAYLESVKRVVDALRFEPGMRESCRVCGKATEHSRSDYPSPEERFRDWEVFWCDDCGSGWVPSDLEGLEVYYKELYALSNRKDRLSDPEDYFSAPEAIPSKYRLRCEEQLSYLLQAGADFSTLLDVGSGPGYALRMSGTPSGFAIEPDEACRPYLDFIGASLVEWESLPTEFFTTVIASHSLEHLPPDDLHACLSALRLSQAHGNASRLLIEVPNGDLTTFALRERHEPHTIFFTMKGLLELVSRSGYTVVDAFSRTPLRHNRRVGQSRDFSASDVARNPYGDGLTILARP